MSQDFELKDQYKSESLEKMGERYIYGRIGFAGKIVINILGVLLVNLSLSKYYIARVFVYPDHCMVKI